MDPIGATMHMTHYVSSASGAYNAGVQPFEYTGWKDEEASWHNTCYIHSNLNPSPTYRMWGPDSVKLLKQYCANSFDVPFPVGKAKHAIFCDEEGRDMIDGLLLKTDEEEYLGYWISPWRQERIYFHISHIISKNSHHNSSSCKLYEFSVEYLSHEKNENHPI